MARTSDVITFKAKEHFRKHLEKKSGEKKLKLGTFIKAVLKKYTGYKEEELI